MFENLQKRTQSSAVYMQFQTISFKIKLNTDFTSRKLRTLNFEETLWSGTWSQSSYKESQTKTIYHNFSEKQMLWRQLTWPMDIDTTER